MAAVKPRRRRLAEAMAEEKRMLSRVAWAATAAVAAAMRLQEYQEVVTVAGMNRPYPAESAAAARRAATAAAAGWVVSAVAG